jgi:hypothetical protein
MVPSPINPNRAPEFFSAITASHEFVAGKSLPDEDASGND